MNWKLQSATVYMQKQMQTRHVFRFSLPSLCWFSCWIFNNGAEYYQAVNTLITSLVLSLFDNSIFLGHLLCLMPLKTQKAEERLPTQRETITRLEAIASICPEIRRSFFLSFLPAFFLSFL